MVRICKDYMNGNCQVLNVKYKVYNAILEGYEGVSCPEKLGKCLCGWYPVIKVI